jgi:hypothetical protein
MMNWRLTLACVGAMGMATAAARAQWVAPDQVLDPRQPAQWVAQPGGGQVQIQVNGVAGPVIIQGGGVVIFGPNVSPAPFSGDINLPIVNDGFANDADVQGSIKPLVDKLRSAVYGEREDASRALLRLPPRRLDEIVEALSHETDAESIERLKQVAAHLYLKPRTLLKTRASLFGVWHQQPNLSLVGMKFRMDPVKLAPSDAAPTMTALVTEIQPGFPAFQTLRNGDRIVAMGGVGFPPDIPLEDGSYFRSRVAELWPGSVIQMSVLREGRVLDLGVQVSGLPLDGATSPDVMVQMRAAALTNFLDSLKTGDKTQASAALPPSPEARPLPLVLLRDGNGQLIAVPMNELDQQH